MLENTIKDIAVKNKNCSNRAWICRFPFSESVIKKI